MESITLREASLPDIGGMTLVLMRANAQRDNEPLPMSAGEAQMARMHARVADPGRWAYVAADGERVVGIGLGYPGNGETDPATEERAAYLSHLMVDPEYWGRRIAGRLLDIVAERARQAGKDHLTLWTREKDNAHARGMYEHKGYILTDFTRESQYGDQVHYKLAL